STRPSAPAHSSSPASRARSNRSLAQPCGQLLQRVGDYVVVGPQAAALGVDDSCGAQLAKMVRKRGLGDVEQRHQLAHADLPGVAAQYIDELQADRVAKRLGDLGHPHRLLALNVGVDDRLTTPLPRRPLGLRGKLQIDGHQSTYIY